jgi:hypothetical protein
MVDEIVELWLTSIDPIAVKPIGPEIEYETVPSVSPPARESATETLPASSGA